ncbi:MAG TPA: biotin transporter BioY [Desulfitobacteriaceae bacterium]|nr:biotin transporter BioY [Desulfitobacteriaceae bacterium]
MNTKNLAMTAVFAALMCLAGLALRWVAPVLVPFSILPLIVYLAGIILGARYGALAMLVYIILGLLGLPVLASAPFGGLGYVLKPTFGFLLGYIGAAFVIGLIYKEGSLWRAVLGVLAGVAVLYLFGLAYLYGILNWYLHKPSSFAAVLAIGFFPYITLDLIKAAIAVVIGNEVVRRRKNY